MRNDSDTRQLSPNLDAGTAKHETALPCVHAECFRVFNRGLPPFVFTPVTFELCPCAEHARAEDVQDVVDFPSVVVNGRGTETEAEIHGARHMLRSGVLEGRAVTKLLNLIERDAVDERSEGLCPAVQLVIVRNDDIGKLPLARFD